MLLFELLFSKYFFLKTFHYNRFFVFLFLLIALFSEPFSISVYGAVANITQVGFTTSTRSVAVRAVSESLTVQTQNSAGTSEQLDETADITLSSTSATGEFSSSATTWNPDNTHTMSKNSSNRTFYYKDTTDGTHTITATVLTRTTLRTWTVSQMITVGTWPVVGDAGTASPIVATSTTSTSTTSSSVSFSSISTHSSGSSITKDPEPIEFEIFGGRDRLAVVGASVSFQAKVALIKNVSNPTRYLWSFGDGSAHEGIKIEHTYLFPGEYVVVLNAEAFESNAVWRGMVKVVSPELVINASSTEYIEVINHAGFETNLHNWSLRNGQETFTFPIDTIIHARKKVAFPYQVTKVTSGSGYLIELHNPSAKVVSRYHAPVTNISLATSSVGVSGLVSVNEPVSVDALYQRALALRDEWDRERGSSIGTVFVPKAQVVAQSESAPRKAFSPVLSSVGIAKTVSADQKEVERSERDISQTSAVITIIPEHATSTSSGFIDTLISWPGRSLRFMRDLIF